MLQIVCKLRDFVGERGVQYHTIGGVMGASELCLINYMVMGQNLGALGTLK